MRKGVTVALFFAAILLILSAQAIGQLDAVKPPDPLSEESLSTLRERRLNTGITSLSSYAHAYYKLGVEKRRTGNSIKAIQAFRSASELDPYFLDPHLSLARAYLLRDPGKTVAELSAVTRIIRKDFLAQYLLFKNVAVMGYFALLAALAMFTVFASVRHFARLKHAVSERMAAEMSPNAAGWVGLFVLLQPLAWGLGVAGTILCYSGSLWKCMSRRERFFGLFFLVIVVATPLLSREMAVRLPPVGEQSPTYISYRAIRTGWSQELESALVGFTETDPENSLYPLVYGTTARRAGKLGIARAELERAVKLSSDDAAALNNLANVYFNVGNFAHAESFYRRAIEAGPLLAEPHYNLAQVFTKRLMFAEANRELKAANAADPELTNEFSLSSREQLNRSVIDVDPSAARLWKNLHQEGASLREGASANAVLIPPLVMRVFGIGTGRRSAVVSIFFALSVLGGILAFKNLYTYKCSNCGKIVCRKCLSRVHRKIFCLKCGAAASALKSEEFTRLLLNNQLRLETRKTRPLSLFFGTVIPGFSLVQKGDAIRGFLFLFLSAAAAVYVYGAGYVFDYIPSLRYQNEHLFKYVFVIFPLVLLHALVLFRLSREEGPQPVSLKLVKTQPAGTMVKDGTTGKS